MSSSTVALKAFLGTIPLGKSVNAASFVLPSSSEPLHYWVSTEETSPMPTAPISRRRILAPQNTAPLEKDSSAVAAHGKNERGTSQLLAEWHGQVTAIYEDSFSAELKGRHGEGVIGSEEEAVIPLEDIRSDDRALVRIGAFFSLCVCYGLSVGGQRRRFTDVVFRRLPAYILEELEQARERARELVRGLRLE